MLFLQFTYFFTRLWFDDRKSIGHLISIASEIPELHLVVCLAWHNFRKIAQLNKAKLEFVLIYGVVFIHLQIFFIPCHFNLFSVIIWCIGI